MERSPRTCSPAVQESIREAKSDLDFLRLARAFPRLQSISLDYAVMEHTDKGAVVAADMGWSDVGSWSALWEISERDRDGNVLTGDAVVLDAHNCYVRGDGNLVAAIGVEDLVVVATDDVVLVVPRDRAQDVKIVHSLEKAGRTEHYIHTQVFRPWGWYRCIQNGHRFQVKEIVVSPGQKLSAQLHHRAEHWIIVSGTAKVTRGDEHFYVTENQSTYIPHNTKHCLENGQNPAEDDRSAVGPVSRRGRHRPLRGRLRPSAGRRAVNPPHARAGRLDTFSAQRHRDGDVNAEEDDAIQRACERPASARSIAGLLFRRHGGDHRRRFMNMLNQSATAAGRSASPRPCRSGSRASRGSSRR